MKNNSIKNVISYFFSIAVDFNNMEATQVSILNKNKIKLVEHLCQIMQNRKIA